MILPARSFGMEQVVQVRRCRMVNCAAIFWVGTDEATRAEEHDPGDRENSLHTGRKVLMVLRPAPANSGIVFRHTDPDEPTPTYRPRPRRRTYSGATPASSARRRGLRHRAPDVGAGSGLGVDNRRTSNLDEIPEVPIMDGGAAPFARPADPVRPGIEEQGAPKRFLRRRRSASRSPRTATSAAATRARTTATRLWLSKSNLRPPGDRAPLADRAPRTILADRVPAPEGSRAAPAPTASCATSRYLRAHGLALGGGLDNAVVLDELPRPRREDQLRYGDEFVQPQDPRRDRRPVPAGRRIGEYSGHKSATVSTTACCALIADRSAWEDPRRPPQDTRRGRCRCPPQRPSRCPHPLRLPSPSPAACRWPVPRRPRVRLDPGRRRSGERGPTTLRNRRSPPDPCPAGRRTARAGRRTGSGSSDCTRLVNEQASDAYGERVQGR
jgi:UDP-3-O-[3-hydroxymyristoyl] N-acetylglucosamine deacetylase